MNWIILYLLSTAAFSMSDIELTRNLHYKMVSDETLSRAARNVIIVTHGNSLSLQGEVRDQQEVEKVKILAQEFAKGKKINNELIIKQ
jgi:osmotically-inducible protein OsmY